MGFSRTLFGEGRGAYSATKVSQGLAAPLVRITYIKKIEQRPRKVPWASVFTLLAG